MTRVLVVDADPAERTMVQNRMTDLEHQVTVAETGEEALEQASDSLFDLVLLSAGLAGPLTGAETCRRLKALPSMSNVPVLVYSKDVTRPEDSNAAYEAHCEAFVGKGQMPVLDRIVQVMLRIKERGDELAEHNRLLELENRRLCEERERHADMETLEKYDGAALAARERASGRPDGVLVVDVLGSVLSSDRGAGELLGTGIGGRTLGMLAPASGLEAFVRDARTEARDGFRFDIVARRGRPARSIVASVVPMTSASPSGESGRRIVLLLDLGKRRIAEEMLRAYERGIPRHQLGTMLEATRLVFSPEAIVGRSEATTELRRRVVDLAPGTSPVLVTGERGAGKTFVSRTLHYTGGATGAFLQMRCSAMSAEGLGAELFGYAKDAFPGALAGRPGLFHLAQDGTVYLAEVARLPMDLQERVLELMEKGTLTRLGSSKKERVDVRVIASSSEDLEALASEGRFLPGLLQKFARKILRVSALHERREDVPALIEHFLGRFGVRYEVNGLDEDVAVLLEKHDWPGNVAALEECIEEACTRARGGNIEVAHLPASLRDVHAQMPDTELRPQARPAGTRPVGAPALSSSVHLRTHAVGAAPRPWDVTDEDSISLDIYEKKALMRALHTCGGDKLAVARLLNLGKSTLYRKLKRFGIT